MNNLQHERISVLAQDLRLTALPDLYGGIAQNAANKKDVSYADFLEDVLKAERDARRVRSREILTRTAGFPALKTLIEQSGTEVQGAPDIAGDPSRKPKSKDATSRGPPVAPSTTCR